MSTRWRIIDTGPHDPFTNMACDEALLRGYELFASPPTLRVYGWEPFGISIGYSQDPAEELDIEACCDRSMAFVRRLTGGGIIVHGNELTYSLVCSKKDLGISQVVASSYKAICAFLMEFYRRLGLDARFACDAELDELLGERSALCFAAKEKYDIVINGRKVGGNAQKRSRDLIFQHGSIPLKIDMAAASTYLRNKDAGVLCDGAAGLEELLGRPVKASELSGVLIDSFTRTFGVAAADGRMSAGEEEMADELRRLKYKSAEWNFNRIDKTAAKDGVDGDLARTPVLGQ